MGLAMTSITKEFMWAFSICYVDGISDKDKLQLLIAILMQKLQREGRVKLAILSN